MSKIVFLSAFVSLVACQPFVDSRGNVVISEYVDSFVIGQTTTDEVIQKCGTPSLHKDNLTWIYISAKSEETSFKGIELKDQTVIRLTFDSNKILRDIKKWHPKDKDSFLDDSEATDLMTEAEANALVKELSQQ